MYNVAKTWFERLNIISIMCLSLSSLLFGSTTGAAPTIAWEETFDRPNAPADGRIFFEERDSSKPDKPTVVHTTENNSLHFGLRFDPNQDKSRVNLLFGDAAWWKSQATEWGPFDLRQYPVIEIKWRSQQLDYLMVYYDVTTAKGDHQAGYIFDKHPEKIEQDGQTWNVSKIRLAADTGSSSAKTPTQLNSINICVRGGDAAKVRDDAILEIDSIRVRGLTEDEKKTESVFTELFSNFPDTHWDGFNQFFPFGAFGPGFQSADFEYWGGGMPGAYRTFTKHGLNFVAVNYENEFSRLGGHRNAEGMQNYINRMKELETLASDSGLKIVADVRYIGHDLPLNQSYRDLLSRTRQLAEAFDSDQTIIGWYIADEPPASELARHVRAIRAIREADPLNRPELIIFHNPDVFSAFSPYLQLNAWDRYPGHNPWIIDEVANNYRERANHLPMWATLQAFAARPPSDNFDPISDAEMRLMAYLALAEGAKGIIWYGSGWDGTGTEDGGLRRTGRANEQYMKALDGLGREIIPIGQLLLMTDPVDDLHFVIERSTQIQNEHTLNVHALRQRDSDAYILIAINEDLASLQSGSVVLPDELAQAQGVYDLVTLNVDNLLAKSGRFKLPDIPGGHARFYFVGSEQDFDSARQQILASRVLESVRRLKPDLALAKVWDIDTFEVEKAMQMAQAMAESQQFAEAEEMADHARQRLQSVMQSDEVFISTRRALDSVANLLEETAMFAERASTNPRWWTGRDHPMLVPNQAIFDEAEQYWEVGRRYRDVYSRFLSGDRENIWPLVATLQRDALDVRHAVLTAARQSATDD